MKDPRVYLAHILECIGRIESYVAKGKDSFFAEPLIQDAVIRNFEVIGEAAKRVPDSYRQVNPSIPWRSLAALRDVLIHQYEGVSLPEVWQVIENELPGLKTAIASLLPPLDQLEREIGGGHEPG
ncbi:MAG: DUF86 domain-containing protein [Acidobacteria bacterium]|nr:DUF86 domain-containing protein [Acidobacteriota bacterium]